MTSRKDSHGYLQVSPYGPVRAASSSLVRLVNKEMASPSAVFIFYVDVVHNAFNGNMIS